MSENKRYVQFEFPFGDFAVRDNKTNKELWNPKVVNRLNEQEEEIQELRQRNERQYKRLKNIGDLMYKRDWEALGLIVDKWEKEEEMWGHMW